MKKYLFFIVCSSLFFACSPDSLDENNTPVEPSVEYKESFILSNVSLDVAPKGGTSQFSFHTESSWSASLINDRASSWVRFSPTSGLGGDVKLVIDATENTGTTERSATFRLSYGGNVTDILLTQKPLNSLLATQSVYELPREGGEINVSYSANNPVSFSIDEKASEWICVSGDAVKGSDTESVPFTIAENEGGRREGRITFTDGTLKEVVSVYQEGQRSVSRIVLSDKEVNIGPCGGTVKVDVSNMSNVTMMIPDGYSWIQEGNSESTNTFYLEVTGNDSDDPRDAFISFTDVESGFSENVTVCQLPKDALVIAKRNYSVGLDGGVLEFEALANNPVTAESNVGWIRQNSPVTKAMIEYPLSFTIEKAPAGTDRTGVITLSNGTAKQTVTVRQYADQEPISFACKAIEDRLVSFFDDNGDGKLSYGEAEKVSSISNIFNVFHVEYKTNVSFPRNGKPMAYVDTSYVYDYCPIDNSLVTSFDELQYFTGLTEIPPYAFDQYHNMKSVVLPPNVKKIGPYAFRQYSYIQALSHVVLNEGLEEIGRYAFAYCTFDEITFPSSLKRICCYAFNHCYVEDRTARDEYGDYLIKSGLKSVTIPEGTRLEDNAFANCLALKVISVPASARKYTYTSTNHDIFYRCRNISTITGSASNGDNISLVNEEGDLYELVNFKLGMSEYAIPEGTRSLSASFDFDNTYGEQSDHFDILVPSSFEVPSNGINPFRGLYYLTSIKGNYADCGGKALVIDGNLVCAAGNIEIPQNVHTILGGAFIDADKVNIPSNVTALKEGAFAGMIIRELVIPETVTEIGDAVCSNCRYLEKAVLPSGCKVIPRGMFSGCYELKSVEGPEHVEELGEQAFYECRPFLKNCTIPFSVRRIGYQALYSEAPSTIIFESCVPPELHLEPGDEYLYFYRINEDINHGQDVRHYSMFFGPKAVIYVPDVAYDRYAQGPDCQYWNHSPIKKLSEMHSLEGLSVSYPDDRTIRLTYEYKNYDFKKIEPGSFLRPTNIQISQGQYYSAPVEMDKAYYIGETEFPQWLWDAVAYYNPSYYHGNYFNPVDNVSYEECNWFLDRLSELTGLKFRLPTEAEWEFAASGRGADIADLSFDMSKREVVGGSEPACCGSKIPNSCGLYDTYGNLREICLDNYVSWYRPEDVPSGTSPFVTREYEVNQTPSYVIRGCYYGALYYEYNFEYYNRRIITERYSFSGTSAGYDTGFRPVIVP